ncbi:hypothetical protein GC090_11375 [Pantoea sp. JZ29]|uniref:hypothetical protein n=1 Tax=Pantoea sp. JZ29 TaxID=2654192 RepID=UPI002B4746F6|nr:hypothetical protein [Pantoea sp. JZ29]WRH21226.1 hypothetical protein GC090_11375 [Pantoea sp. JZ29]
MNFHDEATGHKIIGEAAVNLALQNEEITVVSLIRQLSTMADHESDDERVLLIADARKWLKSFINVATRERAELNWMVVTGQVPANVIEH